jgi:MFS family permease
MPAASWTVTLFSAGLLAIAVGLMATHLRAWRIADQNEDSPERRFAWLQFRRRMQTSGLIGLVAAAIYGGQFVRSPQWLGPYWLGVLSLVLWLVLLALVDAGAIHKHYARLRAEHRDQLAALEARLRQVEAQAPEPPPSRL